MSKLPSHPESKISDPLSILDSDEVLVPYWEFLTALLCPFIEENSAHEEPQAGVSRFVDALQTICYSLTGNGSQDLTLLLDSTSATQLSRLIGPIITSALNMKELFPDGALPILGEAGTSLETRGVQEHRFVSSVGTLHTMTLSHPQISCLICHMILGTFPKPPWMSWDGPNLGPVWFADDGNGDQKIKRAYIQVLLEFLEELELIATGPILGFSRSEAVSPKLTFSLFDVGTSFRGSTDTEENRSLLQPSGPGSTPKPLIPLTIYLLEEEDDDCGACFASHSLEQLSEELCQLVSANKEIGFGPTATQEERVFGSSPTLLPSVLITQNLSATQSLSITGQTQIYGHFTGHLRSTQLRQIYASADRILQSRTGRSFLFLDALEMDGERHGRDLEMGNMLREIRKLMSGFYALLHRDSQTLADNQSANVRRFVVILPPWGCGTFGGDFKVKLLLIWIVASICGISELRFAVKSAWWNALDADWRGLIKRMRSKQEVSKTWDVGKVWQLLCYLERGLGSNNEIDWAAGWGENEM